MYGAEPTPAVADGSRLPAAALGENWWKLRVTATASFDQSPELRFRRLPLKKQQEAIKVEIAQILSTRQPAKLSEAAVVGLEATELMHLYFTWHDPGYDIEQFLRTLKCIGEELLTTSFHKILDMHPYEKMKRVAELVAHEGEELALGVAGHLALVQASLSELRLQIDAFLQALELPRVGVLNVNLLPRVLLERGDGCT